MDLWIRGTSIICYVYYLFRFASFDGCYCKWNNLNKTILPGQRKKPVFCRNTT